MVFSDGVVGFTGRDPGEEILFYDSSLPRKELNIINPIFKSTGWFSGFIMFEVDSLKKKGRVYIERPLFDRS